MSPRHTDPADLDRHRADVEESSALDAFLGEVAARAAARKSSDADLERRHPAAAAALGRARAAREAEQKRRWAETVADAERRYAPTRIEEEPAGPPSYAEIMAKVDADHRARLDTWQTALARQQRHESEHLERHQRREAERLDRVERLIHVEHQLALDRQHQQHRLTHHPRPVLRPARVVRVRSRAATAWLVLRVLCLAGLLYTLAMACLIVAAADHLQPDPTPTTPPTPLHPAND